jgi:hypothetical protein
MPLRRTRIQAAIGAALLGPLTGCAEYLAVAIACDVAGCMPSAHENFLNVIQGSVGLSAKRSDFSWNRYAEWRGETRKLSNGNEEYEYFWGGRRTDPKCIVYWEVDRSSERVVGARFAGTKDTCYLVP